MLCEFGGIRCSTRLRPKYDATSSNRTIFELHRRTLCNLRKVLVLNVNQLDYEVRLDFSKMIVNALIITLSVVLNAMQILEKSGDIIRGNDTRPLGADLSDCTHLESACLEGAISEGMVTRLEWMDGTLPRGLLVLRLGWQFSEIRMSTIQYPW